MVRKAFLYSLTLLALWLLLARCFIAKNRWSDAKAQKVFTAKNVPLQIKDTVVQNRHLHYAISGPDHLPTLVFVHGSPGSWMHYMKYMWDTAIQQKFRVVAIDRPGFGYSNFGKAMHLQAQCNIILPVLQSLKNGQPMYGCGHSFGGPVMVQLAAMDTTLFSNVVIAAGAIDLGQEKTETWRKIMHVKPLHWLLPGAFAPSNTELLYLKKDLALLQGEFKKVTCKVHFIHGDKDTWVPIKNIAFGQKMLVNARRITADTLRGADHQIPWKNREAFTEMLLGLD
jgi:pimeloyl-ACP methyl ester carboxylesterase